MPGCNSYHGAPTQRGCIGHPGGGDIALEDRGYALFVLAGTTETEGRPMEVPGAALGGHRAPGIGTVGDAMLNGMTAIGFHWPWRTDGKQRTGGRSISNICTGLRVRRAHRPGQLLTMGVGQCPTQSLRPCSRRPQARQIGNRGKEELRDPARLRLRRSHDLKPGILMVGLPGARRAPQIMPVSSNIRLRRSSSLNIAVGAAIWPNLATTACQRRRRLHSGARGHLHRRLTWLCILLIPDRH